jgi:sigma-E factor negative regulatory protein RseA
MTQDISSLMDGELPAHEAERALQACCASEEHKATWYLYHAIGDSIRGQAPRRLALPDQVVESIRMQPTVLAPRPRTGTLFARVALAAAASVATVGVVGWLGSQGGQGGQGTPAPMAAKTAPAALAKAPAPQAGALEVQDYLVAHRQIPSPELYRQVNNQAPATAR